VEIPQSSHIGRNSLSWQDQFALHVTYADNRSLWLDKLKVFLIVLKVFRRDEINTESEATMTRFTGADCSAGS
jgi:lipopolysaccharide/colanic/teichoic acid biosynthesis glycosyltransferase